MKFIIPLLASLMLPTSIADVIAQGPPSNFVHVGMPLRQQTAHQTSPAPVDGTQVFGLFSELGHTLPSLGLGTRMRLGGELWMFTAACEYDPGGTTIQMVNSISNGVSFQFFSLSVMSNNSWVMPFGAIGHDTIFSTPAALASPFYTFEVGGDPVWVMTQDMTGIAYPDPWKASFIRVFIPANAALTGMLYTAQSYRLTNPWQAIIYCSDEIVFQTG
jgi:hypothetical protein